MFSRIITSTPRSSFRSIRVSRSIHTTSTLLSGNHPLSPEPTNSPDSPATTQGHASDKKVQQDVQSQYVQQGKDSRAEAKNSSNGAGEAKPFDAARMNGGEPKSAEGKGPFKDQVGGQAGGESGGGKMGEKVDAAGESNTAKVSKALGLKSSRNFSTSARSFYPASFPSPPDSSIPQKPKDTEVQGEQNSHLRHQSSGKDHSDRKGNAAEEPHLPSKSPKGSKGMHTSARVSADAKYAGAHVDEAGKAGYNTPHEALPPKLSSAYNASEATPTPDPSLKPSSEVQHSSTAEDPPNAVLRDMVKNGNMPERNAQPDGEVGKIGLDEAWKKRKA